MIRTLSSRTTPYRRIQRIAVIAFSVVAFLKLISATWDHNATEEQQATICALIAIAWRPTR